MHIILSQTLICLYCPYPDYYQQSYIDMGNICQDFKDEADLHQVILPQKPSLQDQSNQKLTIKIEKQNEEDSLSQINIELPSQPLSQQQKSQLPLLPYQVQLTLHKHNFFAKQIESYEQKIHLNCNNGLYVGPIDQSKKPHGYGKIYKHNGEIFIGEFNKGNASGKGVYVFQNGAYFKGEFRDNKANCQQGYYEAPQLKFSGTIKSNIFQGKGTVEGERYIFEGKFINGKKSNGKLIWKDQNDFTYFYTGTFDQNQKFHGKGVLVQTTGTYEGEFVNGVKQGNGYYRGVNGIKYRGTYKNGKKDGFGIIYNNDETIAYKGEMRDGLPHGKGQTYVNDKISQTELVDGIDKSLLQSIMKQHQ